MEQAARRVDARKKKVEELAKEAEEIKNRVRNSLDILAVFVKRLIDTSVFLSKGQ